MEYSPVNMKTIQKRIHCGIPNLCTQSAHESNSNDKLDKVDRLTDVNSCRVLKKVNQYEMENQCSPTNRETERCELHNKDMDVKKSITGMRVEDDKHGSTGRAADLKFKCVGNARECMETVGRIIGVRLQALAMLGLCLTMVASCAAAPASRTSRSAHHEKYAKGYLQNFGYMKRGRPEVGNLQMGGDEAAQYYEDDFRIAVKTLQEFGGIPVTGEIDGETIELMKQKRCGRPDREEDDERGHRKKRFAVQGAKWKHTNLTWSLSSVRPPSQLDPHGTREVLARALDVWEQASRLTFTEINSENADIVVSFAKRYHDDSYPFDGRGLILAHAFFPATGRGGDAHFDDDELWLLHPNNENDEGTSLFAVAAHEFGHSLGLSHSSVKGALMFPWYQGIKPNFVLPEDDRNGIQQMYGPKVNRTWAMIPHVYRPIEPPPTTTTTTTTTTTRRPLINHHHNRHSDRNPHRRTYAPYPRTPTKYPGYYPERPDRPTYYPDRRFYNNTDDYPRRTNPNHHYPRPTETTTHATTYRPRYPSGRSDYPTHPRPNYPTDPRQDYPRRPYYPEKTTVKPQPPSDIPDSCNTNYDAVALIRNELFIFKNRYHWRIGARGQYPGYPMEISRMWSGLPKNLTHVDAVYERPDRKIAIFVGKELYLFDTQYLVRGYPKPLTALGLPEGLTKLDAAMVWGYNGKTFFFSGNMYWKYDEDISKVELDYPRNMAMWKGVGYNIDSVFQWKDGKTYFFKGKGFWKFNDLYMRVEQEKQLLSASFWMGCSTGRREPYRAVPSAPGSTLRSFSAATSLTSTTIVPFITYIVLLLRSSTQFRL